METLRPRTAEQGGNSALLDVIRAPFNTPQDVEKMMEGLDLALPTSEISGLGHFNKVYLGVTTSTIAALQEGQFDHTEEMETFLVTFAGYYKTALHQFISGDPSCPAAWKRCFKEAGRDSVFNWTKLALGVNAHINRDMPYALVTSDVLAEEFYPDFLKVNALIAASAGGVVADLSERSLLVNGLKRVGRPVANLFQSSTVAQWRDTAWKNAEALSALPLGDERLNLGEKIDKKAARTAKMLSNQKNGPFGAAIPLPLIGSAITSGVLSRWIR